VEKEIASSVTGEVPETRDAALYGVWVQMMKGHAIAEAETVIEAELARLAAEPVPATELDKARARQETELWSEVTSSGGKAERLGEFEVCAGDYRALLGRAADYGRVTAQDVSRVAKEYFAPGRRAVMVAHPKAEE
jgi:zinc protease